MVKDKFDIKVLFIIILAGALILSFFFRPSKGIDIYEDEINNLKDSNIKLLNNNDSLELVNLKLNHINDSLLISIDSTQVKINEKDKKIEVLENAKDKVSNIVLKLDANGVSKSLSEYINKRTK
jgi:hypothetical protein